MEMEGNKKIKENNKREKMVKKIKENNKRKQMAMKK
jgi:hypothetical protein